MDFIAHAAPVYVTHRYTVKYLVLYIFLHFITGTLMLVESNFCYSHIFLVFCSFSAINSHIHDEIFYLKKVWTNFFLSSSVCKIIVTQFILITCQ
jgi:hypothetical protein